MSFHLRTESLEILVCTYIHIVTYSHDENMVEDIAFINVLGVCECE